MKAPLRVVVIAVLCAHACFALDPQLEQATASPSPSPPLSPVNWPQGVLEALFRESSYFGRRPEALLPNATTGGVASGSSNALASFAGAFAYSRGGNAMDACLITAITETVLAANSWVNIMGLADIVYVDAQSNTSHAIYGLWSTPSEAQQQARRAGELGGSVLVGGFLRAVEEANRKFGALPFAALFDAAVYFAEYGAPTYPLRGLNFTALDLTAAGRQLKAQLTNASVDAFTQPELAEFLKRVQQHGAGYAYGGEFVARVLNATAARGGALTMEDFAAYRVSSTAASEHRLKVDVNRTVTVAVQNTTLSSGAVDLVEQLNLVEAARLLDGLADAEPPYRVEGAVPFAGNLTAWSWLIEIHAWSYVLTCMFVSGVDAVEYVLGRFPDVFDAACPELTTANSTSLGMLFQTCRQRKSTARIAWSVMSRNVSEWNERVVGMFEASRVDLLKQIGSHSDAVSATDALGNMCSISHSINTATMWGTGIFVDGVPLTNAGAQPLNVRFAEAGTRTSGPWLATPTRPVVVRSHQDNGDGFAFSAIGDSLGPVTLNLVAELLAFPGAPLKNITQSPTYLFAPPTPSRPLNVAVNLCEVCSPSDYACIAENEQVICMDAAVTSSWPSSLSPFMTPLNGLSRFGNSGPMAISRRGKQQGQGAFLEAASTPELNGGAFWAT